jgi:DNA-binding NtrC family response regulator
MAGDTVTTVLSSHEHGPARRALLVLSGTDVVVHPLPEAGEVTIGRGSACTICVDHPTLLRTHLTLCLGPVVQVIDHGSVNGTLLRGTRLPRGRAVEIGAYEVLQVGDLALVIQAVREANGAATPVSRGPALRQVYEVAARVARGTIGVLVMGETGAGKEVLAEFVHRSSPRAPAPLVRVNCAALREALIESELFGHDRGAFTGAVRDRVGLVEAAHGGTLLLDEVGELSSIVQAKLLRVLEERRVTRVGSIIERAIDVRFIAATRRDLAREVEAGRFRRDLYVRICGVVLCVPPLRERRAEIEPLARGFLADAAARLGIGVPPITSAALAALEHHAWPGNVRELKAAIERAVLVAGGAIDVASLGLDTGVANTVGAPPAPVPAAAAEEPLPAELTALEHRRIVDALEQCGGDQTRAAELLGMPRPTLVKRIAKHGIKHPRGR